MPQDKTKETIAAAALLLGWPENGGPDGAAAAGRGTVSVRPAQPGGPRRVIAAEQLKEMILGPDGSARAHVEVEHATVTGRLDLKFTTFEGSVSFVDTEFEGGADFSFCTFKRGAELRGSCFHWPTSFRAARSEGDFRIPLARFRAAAVFDDFRAEEIFCAEGAEFIGAAEFNRADFAKSAFFCSALLEDGRSAQTQFRGEAGFDDAAFRGPLYFSGAYFHDNVFFDRSCAHSSAFFNCDLLEEWSNPSQPKHARHPVPRREVEAEERDCVITRFEGEASFIGMRCHNSVTFSGAQFGGPRRLTADFRRVQIDGTAYFDPLIARGGKIFKPVCFGGDARFWNADIKGSAFFEGVSFEGEADFEHVQIGRRAFFRAVPHGDELVRVKFAHGANFLNAFFKGVAEFDGALFDDPKAVTTFERLDTDGGVFFRAAPYPESAERKRDPLPVTFAGKVRFASARIRGSAEFDGAQFLSDAVFERIEVGADIYFRPWDAGLPPAIFGGNANFIGASVKGNAEFSGTHFHGDADFTGFSVTGSAYFDSQHHFDQDGTHYTDPRRATGSVRFHRLADFTGANFLNQAVFRKALFLGEAKFVGASFDNYANFRRARFMEAEFTGSSFKHQADFRRARFWRDADFTEVRSAGTTAFGGTAAADRCLFGGKCVFREARFTSLFFDRREAERYGLLTRLFPSLKRHRHGPPRRTQFGGSVDMRGCSYERIRVKLADLLPQIEALNSGFACTGTSADKYDRQPYTQLIKTLRAVGDDRRADFVYLRQRRLERRNTWERTKHEAKHYLLARTFRGVANYTVDWFFWHVGNYGVQPERLFLISLFFILLGTRIFSLDGAVVLKNAERDPPTEAVAAQDGALWKLRMQPYEKREKLPYGDAFKVSLSQFIPIVDIPSGGKWKPNEKEKFLVGALEIHYDLYGTLHRIVGAIFVPLIVAALATALYRRLQTGI